LQQCLQYLAAWATDPPPLISGAAERILRHPSIHSKRTEVMAKGEQRSNREKKKPKQEKAKPAAAVSMFSAGKSDVKKPMNSGKK
jgi:hypothetical protein